MKYISSLYRSIEKNVPLQNDSAWFKLLLIKLGHGKSILDSN